MVKTDKGFQKPLPVGENRYKTTLFKAFAKQIASKVRRVATVLSDVQTAALYTGPKRRLYENALVSLCRTPVGFRDSKIKQFPKFEKQDLRKAPRIINPRTPRYNLETARYLKKLEKQVYREINECWGGHTAHTIIKGLNCFDAAEVIKAKWDRFKEPIAIGLDATKWDAHVSRQALEYEHSVYNEIFNCEHLRS